MIIIINIVIIQKKKLTPLLCTRINFIIIKENSEEKINKRKKNIKIESVADKKY